jgi:hypothetical protein
VKFHSPPVSSLNRSRYGVAVDPEQEPDAKILPGNASGWHHQASSGGLAETGTAKARVVRQA